MILKDFDVLSRETLKDASSSEASHRCKESEPRFF